MDWNEETIQTKPELDQIHTVKTVSDEKVSDLNTRRISFISVSSTDLENNLLCCDKCKQKSNGGWPRSGSLLCLDSAEKIDCSCKETDVQRDYLKMLKVEKEEVATSEDDKDTHLDLLGKPSATELDTCHGDMKMAQAVSHMAVHTHDLPKLLACPVNVKVEETDRMTGDDSFLETAREGNSSLWQTDDKESLILINFHETQNNDNVVVQDEDSNKKSSNSYSFNSENIQAIESKGNMKFTSHRDISDTMKPYTCDISDVTSDSESTLDGHEIRCREENLSKSEVSFNVKICYHEAIHTGEKPYMCDICGAGFSLKCNMQSHKRIHTGEKPYKCDVCDTRFSRKSHMQSHKRIHTGEKPYKCDVCGAGFSQNYSVKLHKRIHTGDKPYKCDVCGARFSRKSRMQSHKRIHTGDKPYKCDICGAEFTQNYSVKVHKKIHIGDKPYKCDVCGVGFSRKSYMQSHKRIHTS